MRKNLTHQHKIYSVYDSKTQAYMPPFTANNDGVAVRHFQAGITQPGLIQSNPEDFSLWRIGLWQIETGHLEATDSECIAKAHEIVARLQAQEVQQANQMNLSMLQGGK